MIDRNRWPASSEYAVMPYLLRQNGDQNLAGSLLIRLHCSFNAAWLSLEFLLRNRHSTVIGLRASSRPIPCRGTPIEVIALAGDLSRWDV